MLGRRAARDEIPWYGPSWSNGRLQLGPFHRVFPRAQFAPQRPVRVRSRHHIYLPKWLIVKDMPVLDHIVSRYLYTRGRLRPMHLHAGCLRGTTQGRSDWDGRSSWNASQSAQHHVHCALGRGVSRKGGRWGLMIAYPKMILHHSMSTHLGVLGDAVLIAA